MARIRATNLGTSRTVTDKLLEELEKKYSKKTKPQVGPLRRILAPVSAIGSGIDAYHDARFEDRDASFLNFLKNYGQNILGGLETLATGRESDHIEGASELIEKIDPNFKYSAIGSSILGRMATDIIAGIVTNPLTYVSFGAAGLKGAAIDAGVKAAGLKASVAGQLKGQTLNEATKQIVQEFGQQAADKFYVSAAQAMGSAAKSGAFKVLGQTVTENPAIVGGLKAGISPLSFLGKQAGNIVKKIAPDQTFQIQSLFDEVGAAIGAGKTELANELLDLQRLERSMPKQAFNELIDSGVLEAYRGLSPEEKTGLGKFIQQTKRTDKDWGSVILAGPEGKRAVLGGLEGPKTRIDIQYPEGASKNLKDFLKKYLNFERGKSAELHKRGFDTLSEWQEGYIHQNYKAYGKNFLDNVLSKEVGQEKVDTILANKKVLKELDQLGMVKRDTLEKLLTKENRGVLDYWDIGSLGRAAKGGGSTLERSYPSLEAAESAGLFATIPGEKAPWIRDIASQTIRQKKQIMAKDFAEKLRFLQDDKGDLLFREEPDGVYKHAVKLFGADQGAEGVTLYTDSVSKRIAENALGRFDTPKKASETLGLFDKALSTFKGLVTGKGPNVIRYQTRNAMDDLSRMVVGGVDMKQLPENMLLANEIIKFDNLVMEKGVTAAKKEMLGSEKFVNILKQAGIDPSESALETIWKEALDRGVVTSYTQTATQSGLPTQIQSAIKEPSSLGEKVDEALTLGGRFEDRENIFRTTMFLDGLRKTGSLSEAAAETKRVLFNYNEMTQFEQDYMKRLIPFYGFVKQNLQFWLGEFENHPEHIGRFNILLEVMRTGATSAHPEEWESMPQWMQKGLGFPIGFKDGEMRGITEVGSSIEELDDLLDFSRGGVLNAINPFIKFPLELATGKNIFRDEDILDINDAHMYRNYPDILKKLIGYQEYEKAPKGRDPYMARTMAPEIKHILENFPILSSANMATQRLTGLLSKDKEFRQDELEKLILPYREYRRQVDEPDKILERRKEEALYELLRKQGHAELYKRYYIPAELQNKLLQELR